MTTWMLKTYNDPLNAVRHFLHKVWINAGLESMLIPVYVPQQTLVKMTRIDDPRLLANADPMAPLMQINAGKWVSQMAQEPSHAHRAAVLRTCEIRALNELARRENLSLEKWLIVGVDCVACFPSQDFDWRVEKAGSMEYLTQAMLRNALQGGIAPYRFRSACRMCTCADPSPVDVCIEMMGLPVKETILIHARNDAISNDLQLQRITDGAAPLELIRRRERMLNKIEARRQGAREWEMRSLEPGMPANVDELIDFLANCQPCTKCMDACPLHAEELVPAAKNGTLTHAMVSSWLASCAECGMCEQACPKGVPLSAITERIRKEAHLEPAAG